MAPVSPTASDNASDSGKRKAKSKSKSPAKAAAKKDESEVEDSEGQSGAEGEGEEEEEEYEIEKILDAKKGQFEKNKLGYFVKWKGYSDEHNSWVIEEDAANAKDLIEQYWAENKKKAPSKKAASESAPPASAAAKKARKSITVDDASDAERGSASAPPKKRGRKSQSAVKATENGGDDNDDDARPAKKPRKTAEKEKDKEKGKKLKSVEPLPEEDEIGDMSKHMHVPAWDHLIRHIDTVERVDDTLYVYFTLNSGERIKEDSKKCSDKFPRKLIEFYESNLRWKEADP
ncbi:hypothetical protein C8R44DRAFT_48979 [Mycena epipterygia]|nr:hypothetical protein C8R44DRAFT_48979 [Mycena epipterygia]